MDSQPTFGRFDPRSKTQFKSIPTWADWRELWEHTEHLELLQSLLHFGFEVSSGGVIDWCERVRFYLETADGHADRDWPGVYLDGTWPKERIHVVKEKAFTVLCQRVFKEYVDRDDIFTMVPLQELVQFFRISEGSLWHPSLYNVRSYSPFPTQSLTNSIGIAREFAFRLARHILYDELPCSEYFPAAVDILYGIKRLPWLVDETNRYCHKFGDPRILKRLEELALNGGARGHATVEEAVLEGSSAAHVLVLLRMQDSEKKRIQRIEELQSQKEATEAELKRLAH